MQEQILNCPIVLLLYVLNWKLDYTGWSLFLVVRLLSSDLYFTISLKVHRRYGAWWCHPYCNFDSERRVSDFYIVFAFMTSYFVNIFTDRTLGLQIRRADLVQQYWDRDNSTWPWVQVWHLKTLTDSLCLCWRSNFHTLSSLWLFLHFCICFVFWSYTLVLA